MDGDRGEGEPTQDLALSSGFVTVSPLRCVKSNPDAITVYPGSRRCSGTPLPFVTFLFRLADGGDRSLRVAAFPTLRGAGVASLTVFVTLMRA